MPWFACTAACAPGRSFAPTSTAGPTGPSVFVQRLLQRRQAVEERVVGLPTTTRPCRISSRPPAKRDPSQLPLTHAQEEELRQIQSVIVEGDLEDLDRWEGFNAACDYAADLINRQEKALRNAGGRIDQGQTWESERLSNWPWSWRGVRDPSGLTRMAAAGRSAAR